MVLKIENYKYTAGLLYKKIDDDAQYLCSATIISNSKLIVAAHCVHNKMSVTLEFGALNTDDHYYTVNVSELEIFVHPQYSEDPIYVNDIAIIQLKTALKFGTKVGKVDMVDEDYTINMDEEVTLVGHSKNYLRYFESTISSFSRCRNLYRKRNNDHPWLEEHRQFCVEMRRENIGAGFAGGFKIY